MSNFHLMEGFRPGNPPKVTRGGQSYHQYREWTTHKVQDLVDRYKKYDRYDMTNALIKEDIFNTLRGYHKYAIEQNQGAHYREVGSVKGATEFEHIIPMRIIVEALLTDRITVLAAMNPPTFKLRKKLHRQLAQLGMRDDTPCPYNYWQRYKDLGIKIETRDGTRVDTQVWNLSTHYEYFND